MYYFVLTGLANSSKLITLNAVVVLLFLIPFPGSAIIIRYTSVKSSSKRVVSIYGSIRKRSEICTEMKWEPNYSVYVFYLDGPRKEKGEGGVGSRTR